MGSTPRRVGIASSVIRGTTRTKDEPSLAVEIAVGRKRDDKARACADGKGNVGNRTPKETRAAIIINDDEVLQKFTGVKAAIVRCLYVDSGMLSDVVMGLGV